MSDAYQAGNAAFINIANFLGYAGQDPEKCRVVIEVPNLPAKMEFLTRLKYHSPPIGEFGGVSAAQAGNESGKWCGIPYEIRVKDRP